jgi:hemolysin III
MRGWLHAGAAPLSLAAGIVLVALAATPAARLAAAVYAITALTLFATSAVYHLGRFSGRTHLLLRRLDHANIALLIAGTTTPFALLALEAGQGAVLLAIVWGGAVAGALLRVAWPGAPRALAAALYVALGWSAAYVIPGLFAGAGTAAAVLVIVGGGLYSLGGLVYALRRPDPLPRVFGYHEVFHGLTVCAFAVQCVAVSLVVLGA